MSQYNKRWYQEEAIEALLQFPQTHPAKYDQVNGLYVPRSPLVAMPTGTGKSFVIAKYVETVLKQYPTCRVLVCTHVKELIEQNSKTLRNVWSGAPIGIFSAGLKKREISAVTFAGIQTIKNHLDKLGIIHILIIDEAHLLSPNGDSTYQDVIKRLRAVNPNLLVIGLTATPYRLGIGSLTNNGIFTDTAYDCTDLHSFNRLVHEGYLALLVSRRRTNLEIDLSNVGISSGEYKQGELQAAADDATLTEGIVYDILANGYYVGRRCCLVFASGIEHAEHISQAFARYGFTVPAIHQGTKDRDAILRDFKAGRYWAVVNNNILTTGFDHPPIDMIAMVRATTSTGLWVQMLGRGTRPSYETGKRDCLVHDYAGNTARLGPINDPAIPKPKGAGKGEAPVWCCPMCEAYNHARAPFCAVCGCPHDMLGNIQGAASVEEVMISEEPVTEYYRVNQVLYFKHQPKDLTKPPSLRVCYHCGLNVFTEWVQLQHGSVADKFGRDWWRKRFPGDYVPETIDEALLYQSFLKNPERVLVHVNKKYPEILEVEF